MSSSSVSYQPTVSVAGRQPGRLARLFGAKATPETPDIPAATFDALNASFRLVPDLSRKTEKASEEDIRNYIHSVASNNQAGMAQLPTDLESLFQHGNFTGKHMLTMLRTQAVATKLYPALEKAGWPSELLNSVKELATGRNLEAKVTTLSKMFDGVSAASLETLGLILTEHGKLGGSAICSALIEGDAKGVISAFNSKIAAGRHLASKAATKFAVDAELSAVGDKVYATRLVSAPAIGKVEAKLNSQYFDYGTFLRKLSSEDKAHAALDYSYDAILKLQTEIEAIKLQTLKRNETKLDKDDTAKVKDLQIQQALILAVIAKPNVVGKEVRASLEGYIKAGGRAHEQLTDKVLVLLDQTKSKYATALANYAIAEWNRQRGTEELASDSGYAGIVKSLKEVNAKVDELSKSFGSSLSMIEDANHLGCKVLAAASEHTGDDTSKKLASFLKDVSHIDQIRADLKSNDVNTRKAAAVCILHEIHVSSTLDDTTRQQLTDFVNGQSQLGINMREKDCADAGANISKLYTAIAAEKAVLHDLTELKASVDKHFATDLEYSTSLLTGFARGLGMSNIKSTFIQAQDKVHTRSTAAQAELPQVTAEVTRLQQEEVSINQNRDTATRALDAEREKKENEINNRTVEREVLDLKTLLGKYNSTVSEDQKIPRNREDYFLHLLNKATSQGPVRLGEVDYTHEDFVRITNGGKTWSAGVKIKSTVPDETGTAKEVEHTVPSFDVIIDQYNAYAAHVKGANVPYTQEEIDKRAVDHLLAALSNPETKPRRFDNTTYDKDVVTEISIKVKANFSEAWCNPMTVTVPEEEGVKKNQLAALAANIVERKEEVNANANTAIRDLKLENQQIKLEQLTENVDILKLIIESLGQILKRFVA